MGVTLPLFICQWCVYQHPLICIHTIMRHVNIRMPFNWQDGRGEFPLFECIHNHRSEIIAFSCHSWGVTSFGGKDDNYQSLFHLPFVLRHSKIFLQSFICPQTNQLIWFRRLTNSYFKIRFTIPHFVGFIRTVDGKKISQGMFVWVRRLDFGLCLPIGTT